MLLWPKLHQATHLPKSLGGPTRPLVAPRDLPPTPLPPASSLSDLLQPRAPSAAATYLPSPRLYPNLGAQNHLQFLIQKLIPRLGQVLGGSTALVPCARILESYSICLLWWDGSCPRSHMATALPSFKSLPRSQSQYSQPRLSCAILEAAPHPYPQSLPNPIFLFSPTF